MKKVQIMGFLTRRQLLKMLNLPAPKMRRTGKREGNNNGCK